MASYGSVDEVTEDEWVFYRDRVEWKDVTPLAQDDGPHPVVSILYSDRFKDVYDYFRAILKLNEKSDRALQLTKDALELNPANYTVWQYRREILKALNKDLYEELKYIRGITEANAKNYQVWHHRRVIVEWMQEASQELSLTEIILSIDAKNYHAWQHRQWVIRTFNLFENELEFVERLIEDDIRNNSAWNQRYFVINNTSGFSVEVVEKEVAYCLKKIELVANNESAWNYLRGVMFHTEFGSKVYQTVQEFCELLYGSGNRSPYLLGYMVDVYDECYKQTGEYSYAEKALGFCDMLANQYDTIRCQYWYYMTKCITKNAENHKKDIILP